MAALPVEVARTGVAYVALLKSAADELYKMLVKVAIAAIIGILVMWGVNTIGMKGLNWVPFFGGVALFSIWVFAPTRLLMAAGAGAAVQGLKDEDLTQGAVKGVTTLYQVALGTMLWFMIAAGILSVISFQERPSAFFPIVGMLLLITVGYAAVKSGTVKKLIAFFGTIVIAMNLWSLVPEESKPWSKWGSDTAAPAPQAVHPQVVRVGIEDVTLQPGERQQILKSHRCAANSLTAEEARRVHTAHVGKHYVVTNNSSGPAVSFRIWFYDEGGHCVADFNRLVAEKAFK